MKRWMSFLLATGLGLGLTACASKKPKNDGASSLNATAVGSGPTKRYVTRSGDSLWRIAARRDVLGDPFRWPLLYKQNRDQIQDPDMLEVREDLAFKRDYSKAEIERSIQLARDTPPYVYHASPRKVLPLQY